MSDSGKLVGYAPPPFRPRAVVLLSGGADSAIAAAWAQRQYKRKNFHALTVDYGQRHAREVQSAVAVAKLFGTPHRVASVRIDLAGTLTTGEASELSERIGANPAMVPGRNMILLSMAAGYAASIGADTLIIGACEEDSPGFPDCHPAFIAHAQTALTAALGTSIRVVAPLLRMTKAATIALARTLPGGWEALALSWTCYEGGEKPCGACTACLARARGFEQSGETDPAVGT